MVAQNDQYWREYARTSCCGNVERGARIIAWLGVVFGTLAFIAAVANVIACAASPPPKDVSSQKQNGTVVAFSQNGTIVSISFGNSTSDSFARQRCETTNLATSISSNVIAVIVCYLIIVAQKKRKPALYLPYIILSIIGFIIMAIYFVLLFIVSIVLWPLFIFTIIFGAILLFCLWMYRIVWRAYRVLKEEVRTGAVIPKV